MLSSACALAVALALTAQPRVDSPAELPPDRPFHQLFQNLARDLIALPSTETAIVLGTTGVGAVAFHATDDDLAIWARGQGPSSYTSVGSFAGGGWVQAGAAVGMYAAGVAFHDRTATHLGSDLIRAQLLNGVLTRTLKLIVDRSRPSGGSHSFPSGHSSATFATAAVLGTHFGWKIAVPAYAAAAFVGWTRVRDDAHWLSDVIIGGAVGTVVGRTIARGHRSRWTIAPSASTTSVGVVVARNP